jgi:hypothetical protein
MRATIFGAGLVAALITSSGCAVDGTGQGSPSTEEGAVAASSAALTVSNTPFSVGGWYGGGGGEEQPENYCDDGYVVVGFKGTAGTTMDNIGFHCAALNPDGTWKATYNSRPVGGTGGNAYSAWCPPNTWVMQVSYDYQSTVSQIAMRCGNGRSISGWMYVAGTPSEFIVGDDCNRFGGNNAMKGLFMFSHTYVDKVQTRCVALEP